jgi:hypothetical protein
VKLLYKPFAILAGIIGARVGQSVFKSVWARIDEGEPPAPSTDGASAGKVIGAAALEAATLAASKAAFSRASAKSFHYLTGFWPGEKAKATAEE